MLIDLHCHTKKAKSGDVGRDVTLEVFKEKISQAKVEIVAITNHNLFDHGQYVDFTHGNSNVLILPGIELDVLGNKSGKDVQGHVIVIVDPKSVSEFDNLVSSKCVVHPDDFKIDIEDFCNTFGQLENAIIMCHYKKSKPITIDDFNYIKSHIDRTNVSILEPSSARKAGIIVRGDRERSWFGSDNHSWDQYPNDAKELPECIFKIKDYNALLSLLKNNQDAVLLKSFLNQRGPYSIEISPFSDLNLKLDLYSNVNVIFGEKATGKTEILRAIDKKFTESGKTVSRFYIESKKEDLASLFNYELKEKDLKKFRDSSCSTEFSIIKNWNWKTIPSLKHFYNAKKNEAALTLKEKAKILNAKFQAILDDSSYIEEKKKYDDIKEQINTLLGFDKTKYLKEDEKTKIDELLLLLKGSIKSKVLEYLFDYESKKLEKYTIDFIGTRITNLQGAVKAPSSFGLAQVYEEKVKINKAISNIQNALELKVTLPDVKIGTLPTKGNVYRVTNISYKPCNQSEHDEFKRKHLYDSCKDTDIKKFIKEIDAISKAKKINDYLLKINDFKKYLNDNQYNDLNIFINYINLYKTDDKFDYKPSNGEASILLVNYAINNSDAHVIILDEPDSGMGADYINNVLISNINNQAANNKIIVISTHDPNLVVRTHPYQCIFREEYENNKYKTYIGSSFEEFLHNIDSFNDVRKWTDTCIDKCEGGIDAITERERTYGHY